MSFSLWFRLIFLDFSDSFPLCPISFIQGHSCLQCSRVSARWQDPEDFPTKLILQVHWLSSRMPDHCWSAMHEQFSSQNSLMPLPCLYSFWTRFFTSVHACNHFFLFVLRFSTRISEKAVLSTLLLQFRVSTSFSVVCSRFIRFFFSHYLKN